MVLLCHGSPWALATLLISGLSLVNPAAADYPAPGACTGACSDVQDISVIRNDKGKYYRFSGHNGIAIATADQLSGPWTASETPAFPNWMQTLAQYKPQLQDLWAPDVRYYQGLYYMYFTVENFGTGMYGYGDAASARYGSTAVATSQSLDGGTWQVQSVLDIPVQGPLYTRFDTSLMIEGTDIFMSFGSYSEGLFGITMENPPVTVHNNITTMLVADDPVPSTPINRTEGAYLYKNQDWYYVFYASGDCCPGIVGKPNSEYHIEYCRAPTVRGPYQARNGDSCLEGKGGTLLLPSHGDAVYAPGSPSVIEDPTHGTTLIYQYMDPRVGIGEPNIRMGWNPLRFEDGWPVLKSADTTITGSTDGVAGGVETLTVTGDINESLGTPSARVSVALALLSALATLMASFV